MRCVNKRCGAYVEGFGCIVEFKGEACPHLISDSEHGAQPAASADGCGRTHGSPASSPAGRAFDSGQQPHSPASSPANQVLSE